MQQHNGFWISGSAVTGPPYTDYWTPAGAVLFQRTNGSVVELVRFNLESFELEDQGVAALFGLELARLVVDTSYTELLAKQRYIVRRTNKPSNPR
jgi:hypothetical protein